MSNRNFKRALQETKLIRAPKQRIATFFNTEINYAVISSITEEISTLREGTIICVKPKIIQPHIFLEDFNGFSEDAVRFADFLSGMSKKELSKLRMLGYKFQNRLLTEKKHHLPKDLLLSNVKKNFYPDNSNSAILVAPDDIWSLSLIKIINEVIAKSVLNNIEDFEDRGFFLSEKERRKNEIEDIFEEALRNKEKLKLLAEKLQHYNLFSRYEDRFFRLVEFHK